MQLTRGGARYREVTTRRCYSGLLYYTRQAKKNVGPGKSHKSNPAPRLAALRLGTATERRSPLAYRPPDARRAAPVRFSTAHSAARRYSPDNSS